MIVGKCWSTVGYRRLDENTNTWLRIEFWYTYSDKIWIWKLNLQVINMFLAWLHQKSLRKVTLLKTVPGAPACSIPLMSFPYYTNLACLRYSALTIIYVNNLLKVPSFFNRIHLPVSILCTKIQSRNAF